MNLGALSLNEYYQANVSILHSIQGDAMQETPVLFLGWEGLPEKG